MAYSITLTDAEYAALAAESAARGTTIDALVHQTLAERASAPTPAKQPMTDDEFEQLLFRKGIIVAIPTGELDSPDEEDELDEIAQRVGPGKPASEMIIEDRGPR
ncbi:MAG: hypothetical protein OJF49_002538 [Ktedonobacterales bacterium]|jgi:hypothetical protein|nr:MAG: hypothetical protein OJF49_002538 [Ktedonobacterales bacterium]